jgi:hypothetical protein
VPPGVPDLEAVSRQLAELSRLYNSRLAAANTRLRTSIVDLATAELDGGTAGPATLAEVAAVVGHWITGAVRWAAAEAAAFLRALVALARNARSWLVRPFMSAPSAVAGMSAAGVPVTSLATFRNAAFERIAAIDPDAALHGISTWWDRIAASEPHRAANGTILHNAETDARMTGRYRRVPEIGACDWCVKIADRGYVYATADFPAHPYCYCDALPELQESEWNTRMRRYTARRVADAPRVRRTWDAYRPEEQTP